MMTRLALPLLIGVGALFLFGAKLPFTRSAGKSSPDEQVRSFGKLSPDEQAIVREQYVEQLQSLLKETDSRRRHAQAVHNMPACYVWRQHIVQLQDSIRPGAKPDL